MRLPYSNLPRPFRLNRAVGVCQVCRERAAAGAYPGVYLRIANPGNGHVPTGHLAEHARPR
jgi:hypothetical protein